MPKRQTLIQRLTKTNKLYFVIGALFVALTIGAIAYWQLKETPTTSSIVTITDSCAQNDTNIFNCYSTQLTDIVNKHNPESAFNLLKEQYPKVPFIKSQCHQLVHIIGRATYAKFQDLAETFTHGDSFCWSGYYHGAMEGLSQAKGEETIKGANSICADIKVKQAYSFAHYNCVHGLGHGFMFILKQNLFESLAACDALSDSYESSSCYNGVFMQNIMNAQPPDQASTSSAYLKDDEPMYPCTAVENRHKYQCYIMQTSHALKIVGYDFQKVFTFCDNAEMDYRTTCYQGLGRDSSGNSVYDVELTKSTCLLGKDHSAQSNCIIGAAKDFVSYFHSDQQANQLCANLPSPLTTICSDTVNNYYSQF